MDDMKKGVISEDPINNLDIGSSLVFKLVTFVNSDANQTPQSVTNWDFFQGALMGLVIKAENEVHIFGTAFMVAPGIALTATHIVSSFIDENKHGKIAIYCVGIRSECIELWKVLSITYNPNDDISVISICAASELPPDKTYYRFGITTRAPKSGEVVQIYGFREHTITSYYDKVEFGTNVFVSKGTVTAIHPYGIGKTYIPYPVIELNCGSLGGMSGGIAIDQNGLVIGIVSRGLDTEDQRGPTYVSWIINSLTKNVALSWPQGLYSVPTTLLSLNEYLLYIDNREALSGSTEEQTKYKIWFE